MANKQTEHAIEVLQAQIDKGKDPIIHYPSWKLQSQSLIEKYFTTDSKEYKWFDRTTISFAYYGGDAQENIKNETAKSIKDTQHHLQAAIETLKIKGLPKEKKTNYLYRLSDTWLTFFIGMLLSGYFLSFQVGRWTVETEKKSVITDTISPTFPITKDKTAQQTDTTKKTAGH